LELLYWQYYLRPTSIIPAQVHQFDSADLWAVFKGVIQQKIFVGLEDFVKECAVQRDRQ
jgi:hypothetical protein